MGLLSDAEKASLSADYNLVAETFLTPLVIYKEAQVIVLSTNPNYNRFGSLSQSDTDLPVNNPLRFIVSGRVEYGSSQKYPFLKVGSEDNQLNLRESDGLVRVKVDLSGYALLKDAKQIEIDNFIFTVASTPRPHGLFNTKYYTFRYQKIQ